MKLFLLGFLRVATQVRKIVDIAQELDLFLLDGVLFHQRKRIVATMDAGQVEIREIFQVGLVPCEAGSAEDQNARTRLNGLRRGQARFKLPCVIEKVSA